MAILDRVPIPLVEVVAVVACAGVLAAVLGPLLLHRGLASLKIRSTGVSQALCALVGAVVGAFAGSEFYRRSGGAGAVWLWYAAGVALGGFVGVLGARRRRPWLQFRLRALFVLTAAAAVVFALARKYNTAAVAEEHAIATVRGAGGWVTTSLIAPSWLHPEYEAVDSIRLYASNDADDELESIGALSHLREVWMGSADVSDRGLKFLRHQTNLRKLVLPHQVTDAGLEHLEGLESLESLDLSGTRITSAGLEHLERLKHLKYLDLRSTSVDDAGLAHLSGLTALEEMDLQHTRVAGPGLAHLGELAQLRTLRLRHTPVDDAGLAGAEGLSSLRWLDLEGTTISDAGLEHLKTMHGLEHVSLGSTRVTQQGVDALKQSLPRLEAWGDYYLPLAQRAAMKSLQPLGFSVGQGDKKIVEALAHSTQINDDVLEYFVEIPTLRKLALNDTQITDAGLERLKGLSQLEYLDLSRTQITDSGLAKLAVLTKLEKLSLIGTGITDAGLEHLKALPNLRFLWLTDTQVTDVGLEHLKGIRTLEYLEVSARRVTAAGAARLEAALPHLDVVR